MHTDTPIPITPSDVPTWYYSAEINLADYLASNRHQRVFRLFATRVIVDQDIMIFTSIVQKPLDIRIDCSELVLLSTSDKRAPRIWLNGVSNFQRPGAVLGAKSYANENGTIFGEWGFPSGNLDIRAESLKPDPLLLLQDGAVCLSIALMGGQGGDGCQGSWGRDCMPPQTPGGEWIPAEWGMGGMLGGGGGDSGRCHLAIGGQLASVPLPSTPPSHAIAQALSVGPPLDFTGFKDCSTILVDAASKGSISVAQWQALAGRIGPAGLNGTKTPESPFPPMPPPQPGYGPIDGPPGSGGSCTVVDTSKDPLAIYKAMDADDRPHSLVLRMHQALTTEVGKIAAGDDPKIVARNMSWITVAAQAMGFEEVVSRCIQFQNLLTAPSGISVAPAANLNQHLAKVPPHTFSALLEAVRIPSPTAVARPLTIGAIDDTPFLSSIKSGVVDVANGWWASTADMTGSTAPDAGASDFADGVDQWITRNPVDPEIEMMELDGATGTDGAILGPDVCEVLEGMDAATVEELMLGTIFGPEDILAFAGVFVIQSMFTMGFGVGQGFARESYQQILQNWEDEWAQWEREEAPRLKMDQDNEVRRQQEAARQQRRYDWDDEVHVYPPMGQFVAVLDFLDPVDDSTDTSVAVFDGFWFPAITNPALAALYVSTVFRRVSHTYTINVPNSMDLQLGEWYTLSLDIENANGDVVDPAPTSATPILDSFVQTLDLSGNYSLFGLPSAIVPLLGTPVLLGDPLSTLFNTILALNQVPLKATKVEKLKAPEVAQTIQSVGVVNVGQGSSHSVSGTGGLRMLIDAGYGDHYNAAQLTAFGTWINNSALTVLLSHWDKDHYQLTNKVGTTGLAAMRWLAPAFGIRTKTAILLADTLLLNGKLYLAGDQTAIGVAANPNIVGVSTAQQLLIAVGLDVPNLMLGLTTATTRDKNISGAIAASVTNQTGAVTWQMLMPGDCSYRYIPAALQQKVQALEAAHHGSQATITGDTIPTYAGASGAAGNGVVYFSNGPNNRHGHKASKVAGVYADAGWKTIDETSAPPGQGFDVNIPS